MLSVTRTLNTCIIRNVFEFEYLGGHEWVVYNVCDSLIRPGITWVNIYWN